MNKPTSDSITESPTLTPEIASLLNDAPDINSLATTEKPWYKYPHLRKLTLAVFLLTLASTNNGYDGSIMNGLQSLEQWQKTMGHPKDDRLGHLANGVNFGCILGAIPAPYIADRFGRKTLLICGAGFTLLGAIIQGVCSNYAGFLCSRLIIGYGAVQAFVAAPTLISEIAYPTHREASTFSFNVCWYLGAVIASWVTYGTRTLHGNNAWKIPSYLQGFMPFVQLVFIWLVPESPRYYVSTGKPEKAEAMLKKYHTSGANDEREDALVQMELAEIEAAISRDNGNSSSYMDFVRLPNFRKRGFLVIFTALMTQLSGNGLVSYYLKQVLDSIGITSTKRQLQINGGLMIYNLGICVILTGIVVKVRRRAMFLTSTMGMLVSYVIWTILSALNEKNNFSNKSLANGVLAFIFLYYLCYNIGLNGLPYLYTTEVLPYSHRAKGLNMQSVAIYSALIYNGYVNTIAMNRISWKYYIVYCCILAVEFLVVLFFYPETSGYTLEEVGQVFGDEPPHVTQIQEKKNETEHVEDTHV